MRNSEYWAQRFVQLEKAQHEFANTAVSKIDKMYQNAIDDIERKVLKWYQRLADNNKITLAEAKRFLVGSDLKEFKWDVKDYIAYAEENALDGKWAKELENASAKFHISKLEALKIHVRQSLEVLFSAQFGTIDSTLKKVYKSGYYKTAYELQKGFNIGFDIAGVDQPQIEKIIAKPWAPDGYNFSERIWKNKNQLINTIHNELTQNILTGADPQKAINAIAKKMNTSKFNAGRLVMTEEAYFSSAAQKDCFSELGVEQYEIVATLDTHTSDICRNLDGKHYPMSEYKAGVTAPPFHVYCRSTTCPYFDDDFGQIGQRAARDENGKTYYVPDNMTYKEWQKAFVNGDKSGLTNAENGGIISSSKSISGALDPSSKRAQKHADNYYEAVRHMTSDIDRIVANTEFSKDEISSVKNFIFIEKHDLGNGMLEYFDPDYAMAQSWQRLIDGKNIQQHDITLIRHELMERELMLQGYSQEKAHRITEEKYNYKKESEKYYAETSEHSKK